MKVLQVLKLSFALLLLQLVFLSGCKKTNQNPTNTPSVPRLAYYIDSKIMVMNVDGTNAHAINISLPNNVVLDLGSPRISPDASTVFFNAYKTINNVTISHDIYSCSINGGTANLVLSSGTPNIYYFIDAIYKAQQQTKIVYAQILINQNYQIKIYTANADGTNAQQVNFDLPAGSIINASYAKPSTDYSSLYFAAQTSIYSPPTIYSCNLDGTNVKQIVSYAPGIVAGNYSVGQQSKIFYVLLNQGYFISDIYYSTCSFFTVNTDGSSNQLFNVALPSGVSTSADGQPSISNDGKTIYFQTIATGGSGNPILSIYSCNIDGSNPIQLATYNNIKHLSIGDAF